MARHQAARRILSVVLRYVYMRKSFIRRQGGKKVADVYTSWDNLDGGGSIMAWIGWLRLGRLPGDIVVGRQNFTLYFPITSGLVISVALTLFLWVVNRDSK